MSSGLPTASIAGTSGALAATTERRQSPPDGRLRQLGAGPRPDLCPLSGGDVNGYPQTHPGGLEPPDLPLGTLRATTAGRGLRTVTARHHLSPGDPDHPDQVPVLAIPAAGLA
jgi:hypothetical protein